MNKVFGIISICILISAGCTSRNSVALDGEPGKDTFNTKDDARVTDGPKGRDMPQKLDGPVVYPDGYVPPDMAVTDGPITTTDGPVVTSNDTCAKAKLLTVPSGGSVVEKSTTAGAKNEFGTAINCGFSSSIFPAPQKYYKVNMIAGKTYRVTLSPGYSYSILYIFGTTCSMTAINKDCSSNGATGDVSSTQGTTKFIEFKPATSGVYTIAVDARSANYSGTFTLTIEDYVKPTNVTCTAAKPLTLVGGKATVNGTTYGSTNQFGNYIDCGVSGTNNNLDGPQVYYSVKLAGNKQYKISLSPSFTSKFYIFGDTCSQQMIQANCSSNGTSGDVSNTIGSGSSGSIIFKPAATGTYKIAVDSTYSGYNGAFSLMIEEYTPPKNGKCAGAQMLTLVGGKATATGDTTGMPDEFGTAIDCGDYAGATDGPQLYYAVSLVAGTTYLVRLKPSFNYARLFIYGNTCVASAIDKDCSSNGATGDYKIVMANATGEIVFKAPVSGVHRIAVDSQNPVYFGSFQLDVQVYVPPANMTCAKAQTVTLSSSGTATVTGNTNNMTNEYGTAINCGHLSSSYIMRGSQLYYQVALTAGKTYTFTFTPSYYSSRMYIFRTCGINPINTDCGSSGKTGHLTSTTSTGNPTSITFTPSVSMMYRFAVDSTSTSSYGSGAFKVDIK